MFERFVERRAEEALSDTPVVLIVGPRRAGKTTLVRKMGEAGRTYITLDDQTTLDAAQSDPVGFIRGLDQAIIDEIQRAPDLLLAIKKTVDEDYRPGRFLLTGSANILTLPRVADSLAGRMETIHMLPLARAEVTGTTPRFLERLFDGKLQGDQAAIVGDDLAKLVLVGGFPEAISRDSERRRRDWARSYLTSVLTRDLRDIADIEKLTELPKFVRLLAEHSGQLVNYSQFGGSINVSHKTGQRYVTLLEQVFLVSTLQPWYTNALKRIAKTPKLHFLDSGLLATTRGLSFDRVKANRGEFGALLESFVFSEVLKLMTGSDLRLTPYHFRDQQMHEVDIVLERDDGMIVGIEVKAAATVKSSDFAGLRTLAEACKDRFAFGVVLYDSADLVPFGEKLAAAPFVLFVGLSAMGQPTRSSRRRSGSRLEPALGWTYLSREALARAKAQMDEESMGVRDEIGFLTIHQGYADRFFPGTSVLHTRARYAVFVPWLFEDLAGLTGPAAARALRERERELAGRLRDAGESQVIGGRVYPKPSSQPPSTVYWNALAVWGILRPRPDGRTISRAQAHRLLKSAGVATDDDGQPLLSFDPPFAPLPDQPDSWHGGAITLQLTAAEATFLRERLTQLRRNGDHELSLLARLVRTEVAAPSAMWADETRAIAGPDRAPLVRAQQAASLAGVGRAVYDALLEHMVEANDRRETSTRHRDHLAAIVDEHGSAAATLDVGALEADIGALPPKLRVVLTATKAWIAAKSVSPAALFDAYAAAEARKGPRARLAPTPNGRARRLEWSRDEHGLAGPLHYRWEQVSTLLNDLAEAE